MGQDIEVCHAITEESGISPIESDACPDILGGPLEHGVAKSD